MRPIRLTDPNGNTAGYICGVCGKIPNGELLLDVWEPDVEPKRWSADWNEMKLSGAERCCVCRWCNEREQASTSDDTCAECASIAKAETRKRMLEFRVQRAREAGTRGRSLLRAKDRKKALELLREMHDFCEETDCATWVDGIDRRVWHGGEMRYVAHRMMRRLIDEAGGIWSERTVGAVTCVVFVPLDEWIEDYEKHEKEAAK